MKDSIRAISIFLSMLLWLCCFIATMEKYLTYWAFSSVIASLPPIQKYICHDSNIGGKNISLNWMPKVSENYMNNCGF